MSIVLDNLQKLLQIVEAIPEKDMDLRFFKLDKVNAEGEICGTLFCAVGAAACDPYFNALGLTLVGGDYGSSYRFRPTMRGISLSDRDEFNRQLDQIFGKDSFAEMFERRGNGIFDDLFLGENCDSKMTDKELALLRIHRQISLVTTYSVEPS